MRQITLYLILFLLAKSESNLTAQNCNPPLNPVLTINVYDYFSLLEWSYVPSACAFLFFEIEYSYNPFTPGQGEGTLISGVLYSPYYMPDYNTQFAWVRTVCDCEPEGGDGNPDSNSSWVPVSTFFTSPPSYPDEGIACAYSLNEPVQFAFACGSGGIDLWFNSVYEYMGIQNVPCTGEDEYVLWRHFTAPIGGTVEISMYELYGQTTNFGMMIYQESCSVDLVECVPSFSSSELILVENLIPGEVYFIGLWNSNYYYYPETGTLNALNVCIPELPCYYPTSLTASQITNSSTQISWSANTANNWMIEYGPDNFMPGEGIVIDNISSPPYVLTNLSPETSYDVYVTATCGDNGNSSTSGPLGFTTQPPMWFTESIPSDFGFCCDNLSTIPEDISVFAYCDSVYFSFEDTSIGQECDYTLLRTITAHDTCGNSLTYSFEFNVYDNQIPGGCDEEFFIPNNVSGKAVATTGLWAVMENGNSDMIYKLVEEEWVFHSNIDLGNSLYNTLAMYDDVILSSNRIFRLSDDVWTFEENIVSSSGDVSATASTIYGNTIALEMGNQIFIFEYENEQWTEVAIFNHSCSSIDLGENVLISGGNFGEYIGRIYKKEGGIWQLQQELNGIEGSEGNEVGYDVSIDGAQAAIGYRYFGGINTYTFDGVEWIGETFITNPYLYTTSGYYSAFGSAIDIEGNLMVAGDNMNKANGNFSGSIVVFERICDEWVPQRNIVPVDGAPTQRFGGCLDLHSSRLVVGIDNTYWLGGYTYSGQGKYWFYNHLEVDPNSMNIVAGADITLSCNEEIPAPNYTLGNGWCGENTVTIEEVGNADCGESIVRTYIVEDLEGNFSSDTQVIQIVDIESPMILSAPEDMNLSCEEEFEQIDPEFIDNCTMDLNVSITLVVTGDIDNEVHTYTWTATDNCGNSTSVSQNVIFFDNEPPSIQCPSDITIVLLEGEEYISIPNWTEEVIIADNCDPAPSVSQIPTMGEMIEAGVHIITFQGIDIIGNNSTCESSVTVNPFVHISSQDIKWLSIYPNPTDEILIIETTSTGRTNIELIDLSGKIVFSRFESSAKSVIDVSRFSAGVYQLVVTNEKGQHREKIVVE